MTKPRRGAKRPPAAPTTPAVLVKPEEILAESGTLRAVLAHRGVDGLDLEDVLQECLIGAVVASRQGRYHPPPGVSPRQALQHWLFGIAVNQAGKYHEKAYRRRETPVAHPLALVDDPARSPHGRLEARAILRVLDRLPRRERDVLLLYGTGEEMKEIARILGTGTNTAFSRLRRGRRRIAMMLTRWRRVSR